MPAASSNRERRSAGLALIRAPTRSFISRAAFGYVDSSGKHVVAVDRRNGYPLPYRLFYSKNIDNLFMAGRHISVTHEALGTVRVMRTIGMMGEVVGKAAYLAVREKTNPRGVYQEHLPELIEASTTMNATDFGQLVRKTAKSVVVDDGLAAQVGIDVQPGALAQVFAAHEAHRQVQALGVGARHSQGVRTRIDRMHLDLGSRLRGTGVLHDANQKESG